MEIEERIINPGVFTEYHLTYGGKRLTVKVNRRRGFAGTRVENIEGAERLPGATTHLYQTASQIIQRVADLSKKPIHYEFATKVPSMRRWAHDPNKGDGIFHWDETDKPDGNDLLRAVKVFKPSTER